MRTDISVTISDIAHTAITQYGPIRMPKNIGPRNHLERLNELTKIGWLQLSQVLNSAFQDGSEMKTPTCSGMDLLCNDYRLLASSSLEPTVIAASYLAFCLLWEEVHKMTLG